MLYSQRSYVEYLTLDWLV